MVNKQNEHASFIWLIVALVVVFLVTFFIFRAIDIGRINYEGLTFTKEMVGSIPVYHYYYLYEDKTGQLVQNNIYLRNNPKENEIPIEGGNISYLRNKFTFVTINASSLEQCSQSSIAISQVASFLANGGLTVRGGTMENQTTNNATLHVTCDLYPVNPVIEITRGDESKVTIDRLCYRIEAASCDDVVPAAEKFIVQSILDAKESS